MRLRKWQGDALRAVSAAWATSDRCLVVAATGTGKGLLLAEVVRRSRDARRGRVLVLAPLIQLVDQLMKTISDAGVSCEAEQGDRMASIFPSLFGGSDVVVACSDSLTGRRLARWPVETFGRVIVDEAHTQTANGPRAILARFPGAKVLGVTATPDEATLGVYGPPVFTYDIEAGIRDGVLCPVQSRSIRLETMSLDRVKVSGKDLDAEELGRTFTGTRETIVTTCAVVQREVRDRQAIVFLPTVEAAHAYRYEMGGLIGPDNVDSLDGTTPKEARAKALDAFRRGRVRMLFNCALFTTGIDLPMASAVVVLRPTKSATLFRQMVGRGLRTHPNKTNCLVLTIASAVPDLCGTVDLFADLPPELRAIAQRAIMSGEDALQVVGRAQERARRDRDRLERQRAAKLEVEARAEVVVTDLFARAGVTDEKGLRGGPRATAAQVEYLNKQWGTKLSPAQVSQRMYRELAKPLEARRAAGLCSMAMSRVLVKNGLPGDMAFDQARLVLDELSKEWRSA